MSRLSDEEDEELTSLFGAVIGLLPDGLRQQVRQELLAMLASGWRPDPERIETAIKLVKLISDRRKSLDRFQKRNQEKQSKARARRPALIALKGDLKTRNPRQSENQLNKKTAEEATRLLGEKISTKQVRLATTKPR